MQNVTETISLQKPGSYTCQIFWKGDPGIENFIIRFNTEDTMKKWAMQVDAQRRAFRDQARSSASTSQSRPSDTQFTYMHDQQLENPYAENDDDDDDEDIDTVVPGYPPTSSSASIRSRSTTGESANEADRVPPPRFPMGYPQAPLTLRTQQLANSGNQDSYFSPVDTPMSTYSNARTSSSSAGTFPFPRQTPPSGYHEENNRYTAPARGHMTREVSMGPGPHPSSRGVQRPSLPPTSNSTSIAAGRLRAASSPDIHNSLRPGRQPQNGQPSSVPEMPPFPTHYAYNAAIVNRSQSSSPNNLPPRAATGSPAIQRDRLVQQRTAAELAGAHSDYYGGPARRDPGAVPSARTMTPHSSFERSQGTLTPASMDSRTMSPPLSQASTVVEGHSGIPTQLKVKVHCNMAGSMMTLVVSTNISFQSLKDRIDAKLQRSTSVSLSSGQVKLKYLDDDTYVTISTDDDLQEAFETWKEQQRDLNPGGQQLGEIELFCQ